MSTPELIDILCDVAIDLLKIVRKQQYIIEQHGITINDPCIEKTIIDAENTMVCIGLPVAGTKFEKEGQSND